MQISRIILQAKQVELCTDVTCIPGWLSYCCALERQPSKSIKWLPYKARLASWRPGQGRDGDVSEAAEVFQQGIERDKFSLGTGKAQNPNLSDRG